MYAPKSLYATAITPSGRPDWSERHSDAGATGEDGLRTRRGSGRGSARTDRALAEADDILEAELVCPAELRSPRSHPHVAKSTARVASCPSLFIGIAAWIRVMSVRSRVAWPPARRQLGTRRRPDVVQRGAIENLVDHLGTALKLLDLDVIMLGRASRVAFCEPVVCSPSPLARGEPQ